MKAIPTEISGVMIFEPTVFKDERGYFFESFSQREFDNALGRHIEFVQDNQSCSKRGVVRGLHFQKGAKSQAKLVRCVEGRVMDIALDLRPGSTTFGRHISVELTSENHRMLFIPRGFAHGFSVLSERAVFQYKCDNYYCKEADGGISIKDPRFQIEWGIDLDEAILSEKDLRLPLLKDIDLPWTIEEIS